MRTIRQDDLIASVADALQYISYYHPVDYIEALGEAYAAEASPAAKDAIAQILTNSRMCAEGHRPICQDTGIVVAFVRVAACLAAYSRCDERLACVQSDPLFPITCPEGQIHAFARNACFPVCDPEHPCASGTCTPWHGGAVCVVD